MPFSNGLPQSSTKLQNKQPSRTTTKGQTELQTVPDFLRKGDVLMVTMIDRMAEASGTCRTSCACSARAARQSKATEQPACEGKSVCPQRSR
jgi:hypothetical protein